MKVAESNIKAPNNWEIQALFSSGIDEGKLLVGLKIKEKYGIDEASLLSGISRNS